VPELFGENNAHLEAIETALSVQINTRGHEVVVTGATQPVRDAMQILEALWHKLQQGENVDATTVDSALRFLQSRKRRKDDGNHGLTGFNERGAPIVTRKRRIDPRSPLQSAYIDSMRANKLVFGLGPAGTGKTYLAIAMAVSMIENGTVEKIILSRPAVEAGEHLGFLPGDLKEKIDPYLRPLYDALFDTMAGERVNKMMASEEIEIAPLAFMRGRTLNNAFVILDEAQNTTPMQMKMFLTRAGENSRLVVTGDPSQTDLPEGKKSGLVEAMSILKDVEGIDFIRYTEKDVVRSALVTKIVQAYDKYEKKK
jgi:phosphate starvation-inducible PhoH-like protein